VKPIKPKPSKSKRNKGGEGNSYGRKMPIRQVMLELERDGIMQIYKDQWGKVQIRKTGGWS
jgi:hypothetical protein